jgi:non-ribosomal peptide synthetase component F
LAAALRNAARRERTLLAITVLTAYATVLSRWCGQEDFLVVFISHGRYAGTGLENMIGFVAHDLYIRVKIASTTTLRDLLEHLKLELSYAYQHLDFDRAAALVPECNREPLFNWQSTVGIRKFIDQNWEVNETLRLQPFPLRDLWPAKFAPSFYDTGADVAVTVYYRPDLLSDNTLDGFADDLKEVAAQLVRDPTAPIASLSLRLGPRPPALHATRAAR